MATTLNFVTFNQDYSCLAVGTTRGFRIYYTDPFSKCFESTDGNISLLEMLFSTSLVAFVLSPRRLQIKNTKRETTICELTFPSAILAVRLNRKRLAVVLEEQIYLYDISNMKLLYTIETSPNPTDNCYLAYPLPKKSPYSGVGPPAHSPPTTVYLTPTSGEVLLFDALKLEAVNLVEAHRSPLSSIAMNNEGTLLATASDKGTIIRVFSVPQAEKLYQFRRGSIPSTIYNMSFNLNSTLLCVSSATETVHVFRLGGRSQHGKDGAHNADASFQRWRAGSRSGGSTSPTSDAAFSDKPGLEHDHLSSSSSSPPPSTERKHDGTLGSILRRSSQTVGKTFASSVGSYLPTAVTEMWEPARDFAYIKIPKESHSESGAGSSGSPGRPVKSVVAMSSSRPHMMVVTSEGMFYVFGIDMAKGGEGVLLKQYTLLDSSDQPGQSALDID